MIKNLLNKYVSYVDNTGWKTFFKIFFAALLYSFVICFFRPDEWGFCLFFFPLNILSLFISPLMNLLITFGIKVDTPEYLEISLLFLVFSAFLINLYHFGKTDSSFRCGAKLLSQTIKLGLFSYFIIVILFYAYLWVSDYDCSIKICGFLKGYH